LHRYNFIFALELIFNVIFTLEVVLKIMSWWSFKKFLSHNYPSNVVDLFIVTMSDVFFFVEFYVPGLSRSLSLLLPSPPCPPTVLPSFLPPASLFPALRRT
jgi:hypothetical protein